MLLVCLTQVVQGESRTFVLFSGDGRGEAAIDWRRAGTVTAGKPFPLLEWEINQDELDHRARLDGHHVLYTSLPAATVPALELLRRWKQQGELERRFSDCKGPLQVKPVYLKTPKRIAALILLLHLALIIFCLIEREARIRLKEQGLEKMPNLQAGQIAAVPTGENILRAFENLMLVVQEGDQGRESWINLPRPHQQAVWNLLGLGSPSWA